MYGPLSSALRTCMQIPCTAHTHTQLFKFIDLIPTNGSFKENLYSFSMRNTFYRCCQFFGKDIALPLHIHVLNLFILLYLLFHTHRTLPSSNHTRIHALPHSYAQAFTKFHYVFKILSQILHLSGNFVSMFVKLKTNTFWGLYKAGVCVSVPVCAISVARNSLYVCSK